MDSVEELKREIARLRALLEASQREVYANIQEKADLFRDPVIGPILQLRAEVEARKAHEQELLDALAETQEEMAALKATDDFMLDELEEQVAVLSGK